MTEHAIVKADTPVATLPEAVEQALVNGNLANLSAAQRVVLYNQTCESLGLNPLTTPFAYITLNGKLVLYATRNCTDQLRKLHNVDVTITSRERMEDIYVVTARAKLPNGRTDEEVGAVALGNARGEALANALMKATTKAKRRVTLSIVGLSLLDETEVETIPGAKVFVESEPLPAAAQAKPDLVEASAPVLAEAARAPESAPAGGGLVQPATAAQLRAIHAELKRTGLGAAWLGKHEVMDVESLTQQGAAETLADLRKEADASAPAGGDAFHGSKQSDAAARETPTKSNSGAMPFPEHAPAGEPAPIAAFFERARGEWQTTRAQTRLLLDPNGLDDDLNDEAAVRAALARFGQTANAKGMDRLFTLCAPTGEPVLA